MTSHRLAPRLAAALAGYVWPPRLNKLRYIIRRVLHRRSILEVAESPLNGRIVVTELGKERRLVFGADSQGVTQSVAFTRGSWRELQREYWGQALRPPFGLADRPRVLILGLGGGTMVHLAHRTLNPKSITVVELDPEVVRLARSHMGLDAIPGLDTRIQDARVAMKELSGSSFDLVVDDVFFKGFPGETDDFVREYIAELSALLSPDGTVTFDRWSRTRSGHHEGADTERLVRLLEECFLRVALTRVEQRWHNELISASGLRRPIAPSS